MIFVPAAGDVFFSLDNTDFVVVLGFLVFIAVLLYFGLPGFIIRHLDKRAAKIREELDEARRLREEAQQLLADYEKKKKEVSSQAAGIVSAAKAEAERQRDRATEDLRQSVERRLASAKDQIRSAEEDAVRAVRDRAIDVAVAAAAEVVAEKVGPEDQGRLIDDAIGTVRGKLH